MRNNIKRALAILVAATIILAFAGCAAEEADDFFVDGAQTTVTITGLSEFNNKYASGGLIDYNTAKQKNPNMALALPVQISNGTVTLSMVRQDNKNNVKATAVSGLAYAVLFIGTTQTSTSYEKELTTEIPIQIKPGSNSLAYSAFTEVD